MNPLEYLALAGAGIIALMLIDLIIFMYGTTTVPEVATELRYELVLATPNTHCLRYGIEGNWKYFNGNLRNNIFNKKYYGEYSSLTHITNTQFVKYHTQL